MVAIVVLDAFSPFFTDVLFGAGTPPGRPVHGAMAALAERCIASPRVVETAHLSVSSRRDAANGIIALRAGERPAAIFCANDLLALGVLQA
jgi:DNA-binding LacI/PurR family transcriptional regulator